MGGGVTQLRDLAKPPTWPRVVLDQELHTYGEVPEFPNTKALLIEKTASDARSLGWSLAGHPGSLLAAVPTPLARCLHWACTCLPPAPPCRLVPCGKAVSLLGNSLFSSWNSEEGSASLEKGSALSQQLITAGIKR